MLKFLLSLVVSIALVGCAVSPEVDSSYSQLRDHTVQLKGTEGTCSAFKLPEANLFLTAAHCDQPGLKINGVSAVVLQKDESVDLMLLYVKGSGKGEVKVGDRPAIDSKVVVVGFPLGMGEFLTEGRVQDAIDVGPAFTHIMAITAPIIFGNSGGPVFSKNRLTGEYELVGIVSMVAIASLGFIPNVVPHMGMVVKAEAIKEFLK